jgi:hypothetical protein
MHMTRSVAAIVAWVEDQPTANLVMIVYWCSIAITFMCEIASITILATISTNNLQDESESWMAVWFFAVDGGIAWIVARQCLDSVHRGAARSQLTSWPISESAGRKGFASRTRCSAQRWNKRVTSRVVAHTQAVDRGLLWMHESKTYVKFTQAGAEMFA